MLRGKAHAGMASLPEGRTPKARLSLVFLQARSDFWPASEQQGRPGRRPRLCLGRKPRRGRAEGLHHQCTSTACCAERLSLLPRQKLYGDIASLASSRCLLSCTSLRGSDFRRSCESAFFNFSQPGGSSPHSCYPSHILFLNRSC